MLRFRSDRDLLGEDLKISFSQGTDWSLLQLKMLHLVEKHFTGADFLKKIRILNGVALILQGVPENVALAII